VTYPPQPYPAPQPYPVPAAPGYVPPASPYPSQPMAPQAYAPQPQQAPQVQYGPPQPMPQPQQQYAPQASTQPAAQQVPAPGGNPFSKPKAGGPVEPRPRIKDLAGRLVAFRATAFEANAVNNLAGPNQDKTQPRVTADCYVFDGGTLVFGGSPDYERKPTPHTHQVETPTMFTNMWITSTNIIRALTETPPGGVQGPAAGIVFGRIVRSEVGQNPWNLEEVPETSPEFAHCVQVFVSWQSGQAKPNVPVPLAQAAPSPQQLQQQATQQYQQQYGIPAPGPAELAYAAQQAPQPYPPQPMPQPQQQYAPQPVPQAPQGAPDFPPPGPWQAVPQQYAALSPADRVAVWQQAQAQQAGGNPFAQ
jgi:hypothetical protein